MHKSIEFPVEMGIRLTGDRSIKYKLDIPDSALMINWKLELLLSSYSSLLRALEPPLQLAEFGENVNKATSHALLIFICHVLCLAYVFPTWDLVLGLGLKT